MIGERLGHYHILEQIGAGGMGVVYRARDERLERDVALKVLPSGTLADENARKRFRKEALTLSKLNHPNIETVHDFDTQGGVDFLVMEYIPGTTLDQTLIAGALPEKDVLRLGRQLADGLSAAHSEGVVHCDLKPGNLRLTPDGRLKILDFGLAKLRRPASEQVETASLTETQSVSGTLPYMAPEQLRGEKADARADIWAAGAVLYEMATGQRPFPRTTAPLLVEAILHEEPQPPHVASARVSEALAGIILKSLDKDPEGRYQSAKELGVDLERVSRGATASVAVVRRPAGFWTRDRALKGALALALAVIVALAASRWRERREQAADPTRARSLAVLPLTNLTRDPEQEYLADGLTETLAANLAKIRALRVISSSSAMQFKETKKNLQEIAQALRVDTVIQGSVLPSGNRVLVTVQLVDVATGRNLWAETYERELSDLALLLNELSRTVAREVGVRLTPQEQALLAASKPTNAEAQQAYLRGRYHLQRSSPDDLQKAREYFERALEFDPLYAPAYAGIADYYSALPFYSNFRPNDVFPRAKGAAQKALELDPNLSEAHAALAYVTVFYDWDWTESEKGFKRALELRPGDAQTLHRYSRVLSSLGRHEEALAQIRRAQELDPLELVLHANVGVIHYFARQYDQSLEQLRLTHELDPKFVVAHWGLGLVYTEQGKYAEAIEELEKTRELAPRSTNIAASLGYVYAKAGRPSDARRILEHLLKTAKEKYISAYLIALVYAGLGDKDRAFEWLQKAYDERSTLLCYLKMDPRLDALRTDPRFESMLQRIRLAQ